MLRDLFAKDLNLPGGGFHNFLFSFFFLTVATVAMALAPCCGRASHAALPPLDLLP